MAQVVTFLSGKGGTGKSSLCAALATVLAKQGASVLCIDCDIGLRNLDIFLGMAQENALSVLDICRGDHSLRAAAPHPQFPTMRFLTAPVEHDPIPPMALHELIEQARRDFAFILLDGPSGLGDGIHAPALEADLPVVVTLPDPAGIRCSQRLAPELEKTGCRQARLVINRTYNDLLRALNMNIDDVMDAVGLPLLGIVPSDPNVSLAAARGKPIVLYSRSGAVPAYKRIAKRLQGCSVPLPGR